MKSADDGQPTLERLIRDLLKEIGEDPAREGLERTPARVAKAYRYLTSGYGQDVRGVLNGALFTEAYDEMVVVKDIDFASLCEHHLLPFIGRCHIAYMPSRKIVGLSKIARLIDVYARRLQTQEHLTAQIATAIDEILMPRGVAVMLEAEHTCMSMRGVSKPGSTTITTQFTGQFDDPQEQARFIAMVRGPAR